MILMAKVLRCSVAPVLLLLCISLYSQDKSAVRIGVTSPVGGTRGVSNRDVRDRLVKALNQHKGDKKLKISIEAVALDAAPGGAALAEAAKKYCGVVLYSRLRPLQTSTHFQQTPDGTITQTPLETATLEYLLRSVPDDSSYASGSAKSEESISDKDAVMEATGRAAKNVVLDLARGEPAHSASADASFLGGQRLPRLQAVTPTSISATGFPTLSPIRTHCEEFASTR